MKGKIKKTAALLLACTSMVSMVTMTSCFGGKEKDAKVLTVKVYKAGYGDTFVHAWKEDFEAMYAAEGYKIDIAESNVNLTGAPVTNELIMGKNNTTDLYITGNAAPSSLWKLSEDEEMDMVAANLNDVMNSYPIKKDKTEETTKIADKLLDGYAQYFMWKGSYYCFPYYSSPVGLVVNPQAYKKVMGDVAYPNTTDELLAAISEIESKKSSTSVYPLAFAGDNAFSYMYGVEDVWVAQYEGTDYYKEFVSYNGVESAEEAAAMYDKDGWKESLKIVKEMQQTKNMANGSSGFKHTEAQGNLVLGQAAFMVTGAWLQNEMYANYANEVVGMEMIKTPIISALGTKIGLKSDATLSQLVACIDEGKNFAETKAAITAETITEEQYNAVAKARGVFYDWGVPAQIVVNSYSPNVELAKLFLRYIASDDAAQRAYAASTLITPYASSSVDYTKDPTKYTTFMKSIDEIRKGEGSSYIYRIALDKRAEYMLGFFNAYTTLELTWLTKSTLSVADVLSAEQNKMKELWTSNAR